MKLKKMCLLACLIILTGLVPNSITWAGYEQAWLGSYNGPGDPMDSAAGVAADSAANTFVIATTVGETRTQDIIILKYNPTGDLIWQDNYDDGLNEQAVDIVVGKSGLVCAVGTALSGTNGEYVVIFYHTDGGRTVRKFSGGGDSRPIAAAMDASENVYITGYANRYVYPDWTIDYCTVKYNSNGDFQWVQYYNSYGNHEDRAMALALDSLGNIFVTGLQADSSSSPPYKAIHNATIKYTNDGQQVWVQVRASQHMGYSFDGLSAGIASHGSSRIYVTYPALVPSQGTGYITEALSALDGDSLWTQIYSLDEYSDDVPYAIAIDDSGCVYVAGKGSSASGYYMTTVKYNFSGVEIFAEVYEHPPDSLEFYVHEIPVEIKIYSDSIIFIACRAYGNYGRLLLLNYSAAGTLNWGYVARQSPLYGNGTCCGGALSDAGDFVISGQIDGDICTARISPDGTGQWCKDFSGRSNEEDQAVAADYNNGRIAVALSSSGRLDYTDLGVIIFNSSGDTIWSYLFDGDLGKHDKAADVAIDNPGNVYITGTTDDGNYKGDIVTICLSPDGQVQWLDQWQASSSSADTATGLVLTDNCLYVTGYSNAVFRVIKYNLNGDTVWSSQFAGPQGAYYGQLMDQALDNDNNLIITGVSGTAYGWTWLVKYNPDGDTLWSRGYQSNYSTRNVVSVDTDNNIFLNTSKYDSDGNQLWSWGYAPGGSWPPQVGACLKTISDPDGNIYTAYPVRFHLDVSPWWQTDIVTVKLSPAGDSLWTRIFGTPGNVEDVPTSLSFDSLGNIVVFGLSGNTAKEMRTLCYSPDGDLLQEFITDVGYSATQACDVIAAEPSSIYLVGGGIPEFVYPISPVDIFVAKYDYNPASADDKGEFAIPSEFQLNQNYPNPFNPATTFEFYLPRNSHVTVTIFNLLGQKVIELVNDRLLTGNYHITWDGTSSANQPVASGIYFYRLEADDFIATKKMVLLK